MRTLSLLCLVAAGCLAQVCAFLLPAAAPRTQRMPTANVVPLELEGQLDPSKSWEVKMTFNGETKVLTVSEDTPILEAAEKEWPDVPNSCRNGICTTCAARVTAGAESLKQAIHGLSPEQSQKGFVLTCQSHPAGPGLELELGMYDVVYETQYGQYERKAESEGKKKAFNVFG